MIIYTHEDVLKMMNTFHTSELNRDLCMAKLTPIQLPQQEISDEEIEKASQQTYPIKGGGNLPTRLDLDQYNKQIGFVSGIMWYRKKLGEQLKNIL
jgi:hypothetical protein